MGLRYLAEGERSMIEIKTRSSSKIADAYLPRDSDLGRALIAMAMEGRARMKLVEHGPEAHERSLAEFLSIAMDRITRDPHERLTLPAGYVQALALLGMGPSELETLARARIKALKETKAPAEPITVETMKAAAERIGYEEIYDVYRHREETEGDRLLDVTDRALTLDQACAKLIGLAGYDAMEAKELGLDQFDGGSISELCDRLKELTGDTYNFSNFETPSDPE